MFIYFHLYKPFHPRYSKSRGFSFSSMFKHSPLSRSLSSLFPHPPKQPFTLQPRTKITHTLCGPCIVRNGNTHHITRSRYIAHTATIIVCCTWFVTLMKSTNLCSPVRGRTPSIVASDRIDNSCNVFISSWIPHTRLRARARS